MNVARNKDNYYRVRSHSIEYSCWGNMRRRCYDKKHVSYKDYAGRGITVCDRWQGKDGFKNFLNDMGKRPSDKTSIDRINNDGNYEPSNCRWATSKEQAINKRQTCKYNQFDEFTSMNIGWQRKTQLRRKKLGICKSCYNPLFKNGFCENHYQRNKEWYTQRNLKKLAEKRKAQTN